MNNKIIIVVLALLVVSVFATIALLNASKTTDEAVPTAQEQLLGGDRDEHGCIPSAGYSWCEAKQKCLKVWEEPCVSSDQTDEVEVVKADIKSAIVAKHGQSANSLTISVNEILGDYAKGGASEEGLGGGMWFGAKVGDKWELVWDGNGTISCDSLEDYPEFPVEFVSECYNETAGEMEKWGLE